MRFAVETLRSVDIINHEDEDDASVAAHFRFFR